MKYLTIATFALATAVSAHAAAAQEKPLILTKMPWLCDVTVDELKKWAAVTNSNAAFAIPTSNTPTSCGDPNARQIKAGVSNNAATKEEAIKAALDVCNQSKDADLGNCVVIGTARPSE